MATRKLDFLIKEEKEEAQKSGLWGKRRVLGGEQKPRTILDNKEMVIFSATNYLGFPTDKEIQNKVKEALAKYGTGGASGPRICGITDLHLQLEECIASFLNMEAAILFPSCLLANMGTITALVGKGDIIYSDSLNHASIVDGCRLSGAKIQVYPHLDLDFLEKELKKEHQYPLQLIVTDGVFSMDGDLAPLPDLKKLADTYEAILMVDDAHGTGIMGQTGRGTPEHFGVSGEMDIITSTLGKAMGGTVGGFTACSASIREYLFQKSRAYRFTNSLPAINIAASLAAFQRVIDDLEVLKRLWENAHYFKDTLGKMGFELYPSKTPIVPIMIRDAKKTMAFSASLLEKGLFVQGQTFPSVPKGEERLRCIISAAHTREDLDFALQVTKEVGIHLDLI